MRLHLERERALRFHQRRIVRDRRDRKLNLRLCELRNVLHVRRLLLREGRAQYRIVDLGKHLALVHAIAFVRVDCDEGAGLLRREIGRKKRVDGSVERLVVRKRATLDRGRLHGDGRRRRRRRRSAGGSAARYRGAHREA